MTKNTLIALIEALNSNNVATALLLANEELENLENSLARKNTLRSAKAKAKRTIEMETVIPVLRATLADGEQRSAKDIAELTFDQLGKTTAQIQYILLHDMADELVKVEAKGKPNLYGLKA